MSKMIVKFSKTIRVVVDAEDDLSAVRNALSAPGIHEAFYASQTIFEIQDAINIDDLSLGVVVEPLVEEIIT